jgi:hypothetical protein
MSNVVLSLETETVGGVISPTRVSTVIVTELFASEPSTLKFPDASENLLLDTLTTPGVVLLAVGVNVAEYVVPLPVKLLSVPPDDVMSPTTKSVTDSLIVKLSVAVWPRPRVVLLLAMAIVGGVVSVGAVVMSCV